MTRRVHVTSETHKAIWIPEHPIPTPAVGEVIRFGEHSFRVLSVHHHYSPNQWENYHFMHTELRTAVV